MENKRKIVRALEDLLKQTRAGEDIEFLHLRYDENGDEWVYVHYKDDYIRKVIVTADSGIALIRDVLRAL